MASVTLSTSSSSEALLELELDQFLSSDRIEVRSPVSITSTVQTIEQITNLFDDLTDDESEATPLISKDLCIIPAFAPPRQDSVKSKIINDETEEYLLSEARISNWYKYAGYGVLGMIGIAVLITGIFFGYTWVGLAIATAAFVISAYGIKRVDDQVKEDYEFQTPTRTLSRRDFDELEIQHERDLRKEREELASRKPSFLDSLFPMRQESNNRKRKPHPLVW